MGTGLGKMPIEELVTCGKVVGFVVNVEEGSTVSKGKAVEVATVQKKINDLANVQIELNC